MPSGTAVVKSRRPSASSDARSLTSPCPHTNVRGPSPVIVAASRVPRTSSIVSTVRVYRCGRPYARPLLDGGGRPVSKARVATLLVVGALLAVSCSDDDSSGDSADTTTPATGDAAELPEDAQPYVDAVRDD